MTTRAACPFCFPIQDRIAFEDRLTRALWDAFPVSEGHLLIVPRRHVPTWFDASTEERAAITAAIDQGRELLASRHHPDGFNIGINVGEAAGQTVFHLHVHLIPRYGGDVPDPRGGVRHVIPGKGRYPAQTHGAGRVEDARWTKAPPVIPSAPSGSSREESAIEPPVVSNRLVSGGEDGPLYRYLREQLAVAAAADIAVGFVMPSGRDRLEPHLRDFLGKRDRLRFLTGDYLGVREPEALARLLDIEGDRRLRVFETTRPPVPEHPGPSPELAFHPKAYIFERANGTGVAFVGSSNLSHSALLTGIEWNYRTVEKTDTAAFQEIRAAFDRLFAHPATKELTRQWIDAYRHRRPARSGEEDRPDRGAGRAGHDSRAPRHPAGGPGSPRSHEGAGQRRRPRRARHRPRQDLAERLRLPAPRVPPDCHSEDPKGPRNPPSRDTYRRIRPHAHLGFYKGEEREEDADVLFASIQTLGRVAHLERFPRDAFAIAPPPRGPTAATSSLSARRTSSTAATSSRASSRTSSAASATSASRTRWTTGRSPGATPASMRRS
jgi:diadenosine tetraphosphate (Ap4A) HIT family hydrolase/HKD family nuclease